MTLVLENREDEMSGEVQQRIRYANTRLQEYVDQILYFSRVNCEHKDYLFEETMLYDCVEEVLFDYGYFLKEKGIQVVQKLEGQKVFTDRKGLEFMIRQAVANAIKYIPGEQEEKRIEFKAEEREDVIILKIRDNGIGVPQADLPFVFDKGFAGENGTENKKSTGMGLYLLKEMAKSLNITCRAVSAPQEGFCIELCFPVV